MILITEFMSQNAVENLKKKSAEELSKVTGGLNLPADNRYLPWEVSCISITCSF